MIRRVSIFVTLALAVAATALSYNGRRRGPNHLELAARAFAARRFATAARLLRRTDPEELGSMGSGLGSSGFVSGGWPGPQAWVSPLGFLASWITARPGGRWRIGAVGRPVAWDTVVPLLAAAELAGGHPKRALDVVDKHAAAVSSVDDQLVRAREAIADGRFAEAYRALGQDAAALTADRGEMAGAEGRHGAAVLAALIAGEPARMNPYSAEDRVSYADVIRAAGGSKLLPTAESQYREALRLDPGSSRALVALGRLDEAVRVAPQDASARRARVQRYQSDRRRRATVRGDLETICRLDPSGSSFERRQLVDLCVDEGNYARALRHLDALQAIANNSNSREQALWVRGWLLAEAGRLKDAAVEYDRALATPSTYMANRPILAGLTYVELGDLARARYAFFRGALETPYRDLFGSWCADVEMGGNALTEALAEHTSDTYGPVRFDLPVRVTPYRQAERVLAKHPDCLPAALLLLAANSQDMNAVRRSKRLGRVVALLEPFARRYPGSKLVQESLRSARAQAAGTLIPMTVVR